MSVTITLEAERVKCPNCQHLYEEEIDELELPTAYECAEDGAFSSDDSDGTNRCPECNKFAAKMGLMCSECNEPIEGDLSEHAVPVITCGCHEELHEVNY